MKNSSNNLRSWFAVLFQMSTLGLVICLGYWGWLKLTLPTTLPFKTVKIIALNQRVSANQLEQIVKANINGGFFSLNITNLKQQIKKMSWVASVSVKRIWPNVLTIVVQEHIPQARWNDVGVIDEAGNIFYPDLRSVPTGLPWLHGLDSNAQEMLGQYQEMNQQLQNLQLSIAQLTLSPRQAWQILLSNHILLMLGREEVMQRFTRFVTLYQKVIGSKADQVSVVDLRYPNGISVMWKNQ